MDNNAQHTNDTVPNFEFHYDGATDTIKVFAHCIMHGHPCRGWLAWTPIDPAASHAPLFRLSPRRDHRSLGQLKAVLGAFDSPAPIIIDLKHFKGLPIESAPKDGTPILIHEPGLAGWIQAKWEDTYQGLTPTTREPFTVDAHWESDHHAEFFSKLNPDLWLPLPGGGK